VARTQLLGAGIDGSAIGRALRAGKLHRVYRGIYATVAPELLTEEGQLIAALLAAGVAVPRHREVGGLSLQVSGRYRAGDVTVNGRFPSTTVARTLLDLATRYEHGALLRAPSRAS
jgi:hypothetical protein